MNLMSNTELFDRLGEPGRMRSLAEYDLFHPDLQSDLDRIATSSANRLHTPISTVSILLDSAQFIIGRHGLPDSGGAVQGTPAEWALCTHTVLTGSPYCITDSRIDPLHADNPLFTMIGLRSYAGVPLRNAGGQVLGAHCVIDTTPRPFSEDDIVTLAEGAADVLGILERYRIS
jgi:GAF domain-containing protein